MRTIRHTLRPTLIALLAISVNLPMLGAASLCAPNHPAKPRTQSARSCCVRKAKVQVETPPCCCSRDRAAAQGPAASHTASSSGCLCRSEVPPPPPTQQRDTPSPESQATSALATVSPVDATLAATPHLLATAAQLAPDHVPLYLGNARLRF